ncbi:MAG: hypothetical protein BWY76_00867 [bacterium ADurb.Bin429]|nr:MAG: hypothetical protein BWY76_00867 [bacterium ADurb.Bin429]
MQTLHDNQVCVSIPAAVRAGVANMTACDGDIRLEEVGSYNKESWLQHFGQDADFQAILLRFQRPISRQDFTSFGTSILESSSATRQLFLITMLWGYSTIGYGAWRTRKMMDTPNADRILQETVSLIAKGHFADAYSALRLDRCGPAFMAKFLYAAGLALEADPLPLILDSRVAVALKSLFDENDINSRPFLSCSKDGMVRHDPICYERYVLLLNHWAKELKVRPDDIEAYLFG